MRLRCEVMPARPRPLLEDWRFVALWTFLATILVAGMLNP